MSGNEVRRFPLLYAFLEDTFSAKAVMWMLKYRPKYCGFLEKELETEGTLEHELKWHLFEQLEAVEWDFAAKRG